MRVLVDTSVWSLALRKKEKTEAEQHIVDTLAKLIRNLDVVLIGPVRQEILSGISDEQKFIELKTRLALFEDLEIRTEDYETAAQLFNECRKHGIQGSHIDFLICAVALNHDMPIFTLDKDFERYQEYVDIRLYRG
ncbi:MAG: type II toxin-antitoxin system VapC family toxin [Rectinema subterraneum]|jgi:predicted nucleic acid-binding protein